MILMGICEFEPPSAEFFYLTTKFTKVLHKVHKNLTYNALRTLCNTFVNFVVK